MAFKSSQSKTKANPADAVEQNNSCSSQIIKIIPCKRAYKHLEIIIFDIYNY